jgi:hypothetical protein
LRPRLAFVAREGKISERHSGAAREPVINTPERNS